MIASFQLLEEENNLPNLLTDYISVTIGIYKSLVFKSDGEAKGKYTDSQIIFKRT